MYQRKTKILFMSNGGNIYFYIQDIIRLFRMMKRYFVRTQNATNLELVIKLIIN